MKMINVKRIILSTLLLLAGIAGYAQPVISGSVFDVESQMVVNREVVIYTDSSGVPYPYYDTTYTDMNGNYSFTLPQGIPVGVIFKVTTYNCGNSTVQNYYYPYSNSSANFIVCATNRYIRGHIYKGTTSVVADIAMVSLIRKHIDSISTTVELVDSALVDANGFYLFTLPLTSADSYLVKAALLPADTADYIHYVPSYYNGVLRWSSANVLQNGNHSVDIPLPQGINMQGQGYVTGTVNNSLYKRILLLTTDNDVPVAYRYSNTSGEFSFGGLNYGSYKLFGDALGRSNPGLEFTLSATNPSITDITFYETNTEFYGTLWPLNVAENIDQPELTIYPNPVADYLHIQGLGNIAGDRTISLYSISGTQVYNRTITDNKEVLIPFSELAGGLYMLHIKSSVGDYHFKVVR